MTLAEYETPEFRKRAEALEHRLRTAIALNQPVALAEVASELQVPLDIAAAWIAVKIAIPLGETMRISVVDEKESA